MANLRRTDVARLSVDADLDEAEREFRQFSARTQGQLERMDDRAGRTATTFASLRTAMLRAGAAVGALTALALGAKQLADRADEITNLNRGFDAFAVRLGTSSETLLPRLRVATRGLASDITLMQQANQAVALGLPVTEESMAQLFEGATRLGRALGVDVTRAIESVVTGIGRQSRLMLDNLGIIVDVEEANRKYAESMGIVGRALNETERNQAFYNEAVFQLGENTKTLNDETITFSELFTIFWTNEVNRVNEGINQTNESLSELIDTSNEASEALRRVGALTGSAGARAGQFIPPMLPLPFSGPVALPQGPAATEQDLAGALRIAREEAEMALNELLSTNRETRNELQAEHRANLEAISEAWSEQRRAQELLAADLGEGDSPIAEMVEDFRALNDQLTDTIDTTNQLTSGWLNLVDVVNQWNEAGERAADTNGFIATASLELVDAVGQMGSAFFDLAASSDIGLSSVKRAMGEALLSLGSVMAAYAAASLAFAALAGTAAGQVLGLKENPGVYLRAAALFGAAAAGAFVAGRALGAGGGGGQQVASTAGAVGGDADGGVSSALSIPNQRIDVNIVTRGIVQDVPGFAREVGEQIGRQFGRTGQIIVTSGGGV